MRGFRARAALTGSLARGEGSVLSVAGRLKVLGDIEFFVVLARGEDYRGLRAEMATWGPIAAATLGADRVHADLEFGPVHVGYLRRARPSIFVYDLRHHGKVLWGPPDLLEDMPSFTADAIPREDALRLLLNRTIEQLDAYDRIDTLEGDAVLDVAYQRLKIVLDLAGSALAFSGVHCASYASLLLGAATGLVTYLLACVLLGAINARDWTILVASGRRMASFRARA